ncbi:4'-phosphopantetheinyl transferase superfamily protein [Nocardioides daphniae]|uniref:4'-phosphopantetheinyl transferase superfamily protein n=1 Tax=Nocardioides daphniae TaxID=402297 RepID=UPI001EE9445A|nr:4'-phosphopantetheinyl transferase superfamily protein [Nocardioides daphniae]
MGLGVAIAADGVDVGIDVERVDTRGDQFASTAMAQPELDLFDHHFGALTGRDRDRELTRWWAAKEAAAKALGTGLQGRPRDFVVAEVAQADGEVALRVGERWIATTSVFPTTTDPSTTTASSDAAAPEEYIVAWTDLEPRHG